MEKRNRRVPCVYNHEICKQIDDSGGARGGGCMLILSKIGSRFHALLGYEKWRSGYTVCAGKRGKGETCYLEVVERELIEEFKFDRISIMSDPHFNDEGSTRFIVVDRSPIFIGIYEHNEIDTDYLNKRIEDDNQNPSLPKSFKEMDHLKWIRVDEITTITKKNLKGEEILNYIGICPKGTSNRIAKYTYKIFLGLKGLIKK